MTIRQTILGIAPAPNTVQKIKYTSTCTGEEIPDNATRSGIHQDLSEACRRAPKVTRTVWVNENSRGGGVRVAYPSSTQKAMAVCFRADELPDFARITAELSVTYLGETSWKTLRRSIDLIRNELGSDIEILNPR